jgi:hypothetical protein
MGYAPGLAWVRFNPELAFHHGAKISKAPSFPQLQTTPQSIIIPIVIFRDAI